MCTLYHYLTSNLLFQFTSEQWELNTLKMGGTMGIIVFLWNAEVFTFWCVHEKHHR